MGFSHFRIGHAGKMQKVKRADPNPSCATGGFYTHPKIGDSVNALDPLDITWDTTCLATSSVDIYLYAPGSQRSTIHVWEQVDFTKGSYTAELMPRWWNSTSSQSLQLTIVDAGSPTFLNNLPAGPVFTATYTAPASGPVPTSADTSQVDSGVTMVGSVEQSHGLSGGSIAAAVIVPLLFIALLAAAYLKMQRAKGRDESKRFSEAVDKRMSTISTDWKSMSAAGANAAIRNSMAVSSRNSTAFSFGAIRPVSTLDGGQAGVGAGAMFAQDNSSQPSMSQFRRPGVGPRMPAASGERVSRVSFATTATDRVSRVSFAVDARPSGESRRTANGQSRAFHSAYVPPLPTARIDTSSPVGSDSSVTVSPTQRQGPLTLTPEDIRNRISGGKRVSGEEGEMDEVMPALSMMRTGSLSSPSSDDLLFEATSPVMPSPIYTKPTAPKSPYSPMSPTLGPAMDMQPVPANMMSPDEMLRAYATRKSVIAKSPTGFGGPAAISYPTPIANNNMRILYGSPTSPTGGYYSAEDEERENNHAYLGTAE